MTWARLDDGYWCHRKVCAVSLEAVGMHARMISFACQQETDGFVPPHIVDLIRGTKAPANTTDELGNHRLIHPPGTVGCTSPKCPIYRVKTACSEFVLHDFLACNPSKKRLEMERERRAKSGQKGGYASAASRRKHKDLEASPQAPATGDSEANTQATTADTTGTPRPDPTPLLMKGGVGEEGGSACPKGAKPTSSNNEDPAHGSLGEPTTDGRDGRPTRTDRPATPTRSDVQYTYPPGREPEPQSCPHLDRLAKLGVRDANHRNSPLRALPDHLQCRLADLVKTHDPDTQGPVSRWAHMQATKLVAEHKANASTHEPESREARP